MFCLNEVISDKLIAKSLDVLVELSGAFSNIYSVDGALILHSSALSCNYPGNLTIKKCKQLCKSKCLSTSDIENIYSENIAIGCPLGLVMNVCPIIFQNKPIGFISVGLFEYNASTNNSFDKFASSVSNEKICSVMRKTSLLISEMFEEKNETIPSYNGDFYSKEKSASLQAILKNFPSCVTIFKKTDNDLKVIYANKSSLKYYGKKSLVELKGSLLSELIPDSNTIIQLHLEVIKSGKPKILKEYSFPSLFSNNPCWWTVRIDPYYSNGKIIGTISIRTDITKHILTRERLEKLSKTLKENSEHLETIFDNTSEGLILFDADGNYVSWNKAACKILGVTKKIYNLGQAKEFFQLIDASGSRITDSTHPIYRILKGDVIKDLILTVKINNYKKGIKSVLFNGHAVYDKNKSFLFGLLTIKDIESIQEENRRFEEHWNLINTALDNLKAPLFVVSFPSLKFVLANNEAITLCNKMIGGNLCNRDVLNRPLSSFNKYFGNKNFSKYLLALGNMRIYDYIIPKFTISYGDEKHYYTSISSPIKDSTGKTTHIICTAFDITTSILYNAQIEEISRMKEEFFSNISHEFKTPLTVILGALQMMSAVEKNSSDSEFHEKSNKYSLIIRQNCNRLVRLINNLLDVTKLNSGHALLYLREIDIVSFAQEITSSVSVYALQKNISLTFSSNISSKIMSIDVGKIERVLLNLLSNAVKFTAEGKNISVTLKDKKAGIEINVADTGVGIPSEKLKIIFERFRQVDNFLTRSNEGSGLGLFLVKSLVELHNGTISVKSTVGKGSTFKIFLPCLTNNANSFPSLSGAYQDQNIIETTTIEFSDLKIK